MKKLILLIIILSIITTFLFLKPQISGKIIENSYSYTKAICDENNYCEDYYIECKGKTLNKLTPTGFSIQHSENWTDNRNISEDYC